VPEPEREAPKPERPKLDKAGRAGLGGYPVNLLIAGRRCVVVGGGRIAARKIEALLDAGADVHVVAPVLDESVRAWAGSGHVTVDERVFEPADLDGAWLATAATSDPAVNRAVFDAGEARRVWVNAADDPDHCSFTLVSVVRQGDLVVTIGTGGRSPALATYLKAHVRDEMGPEYGVLLDVLSEAREAMRAEGRSSEDADWQRALDSGMLDLIRTGRVAEAKELLETCLSSSSG
jgi:siroheme synthase-like protein